MNPNTGFWEGAEADEEGMSADEAIAAGHTPGDSVPGVSTRELVQALASREEAPATPPAAIPAAPSDALKQWAWHWFGPDADEEWIANALANLPGDALTQPTTVQQGVPDETVREAGRAWAYAEGHEFPGESADAYLEGHRAALKTAQTTALPGADDAPFETGEGDAR